MVVMALERVLLSAGLVVALGLPAVLTAQQAQEPVREETADTRLERKIEELMQLPDQNAVLEQYVTQGFIQTVQYDSTHQQTNFRELVYQESTEPQNKKPVLTFFYTRNNSQSTENENIKQGSMRSAILFGLLSEELHNAVRFVTYDLRINSEYVETATEVHCPQEVQSEGITGIPDIALYNIFDLVRRESEKRNDGVMKKIDAFGGGLKNSNQIEQLLRDFPVWWIRPNAFEQPTPDND